jgi:hypothetical protein
MTDWSYLLLAGSIYALGFLGLFGITLLPLRAFQILRRNSYLWRTSALGKTAVLIAAVAGISAISMSIPQVVRMFRCLTEMHCGANRASGWFTLAFIGVYYLGFEVVTNVVLAIARKVSRVAT